MVIARRNLLTCRMVARLVAIDRETAASLARKAGDRQPDGQGRKHHVTGQRRGFIVADLANTGAEFCVVVDIIGTLLAAVVL
jgi:hypothetical protein